MRQTKMNTMSQHIPASAGSFRIVREKRIIRGRAVRVCTLVFTTTDGFVGESIPRHGRFDHRGAYEAAVAARAAALFKASQAAANQLPRSAFERVHKPAPSATLLHAIKDTLLFSEVERRGFEVSFA